MAAREIAVATQPGAHGGAILDSSGNPMRLRAGGAAHAGADKFSQELANWSPALSSPDADLSFEREALVARSHDLARNNGWAAGGIQRHVDAVIGAGLRLSAKPDWRALGQDADWAAAWASDTEGKFRLWADDPGHYCDAARHTNLGGLFGLAYRHRLMDGEALALPLWLPNRGGRYATSIQIVDPARLSSPMGTPNTDRHREGVDLDQYGAAVAFHIAKAHPGDFFGTGRMEWERIPAETSFGRRRVIHYFERERTGQTRGKPIMSPIIERLKMLDRYDRLELQSAVLNATFAAFIESPFDHEMLDGALDGAVGGYQAARTEFHKDRRILLDGVRIPKLFPGEQFKINTAARPGQVAFADFERATLRNVASGFGLSYEQLSQDWSSTNYSSARAALLEAWRFLTARRSSFGARFASQVYALWLEEAIDMGDVALPPGAPSFHAARAAWCRARWIGPPRGWVDPTKEALAAQMRMDAGLSTLENENAEQGLDWEETLAQRSREMKLMKALGIEAPDWKIQELGAADDAARRDQRGAE